MSRRSTLLTLILTLVLATPLLAQPRGKALDIYYIDVEGGQATLFVSPSGESLLVDTGFPGERDAGRIMETVKAAGLTQVHPLRSREAIMNNGIRKGGSVEAFRVLETAPGLEDIWQLHWSDPAGIEHNVAGVEAVHLRTSRRTG